MNILRTKQTLSTALIVVITSCLSSNKNENPKYNLVLQQDGILIEKFDSVSNDEPLYNLDNTIYLVGREFIYSYEYEISGRRYLFKYAKNDWELVPYEKADSSTVRYVKLSVLPMVNTFNDGETLISYKLEPEPTFSMTGVTENEANIWLHPPRDALFGILELNPFPYVKFPLEIGNKWNWKLSIGDHWADSRWKTWEGRITNSYSYEIIGKSEIKTQLGKLNCYEIISTAESQLGQTSLHSWFNSQCGFVKLEYSNIDDSSLNLNLISVEKSDKTNPFLKNDIDR